MAIRRLKGGEVVLTGLDRPIPSPKHRPCFFGRPSSLPIHHIHLALAAGVPMVVMGALQQPDRRYKILFSEEISMQPHPNRDAELMMNAERILEVAAGYIRQAPDQWCVLQPAWPEAILEMP
jgi:lauroyl/myristoyl acyltransferase